ncbi:multi-copy leucine-rich repeat protein, putative [Bodo saltans]|uniref:Multi-copy leucine-rich repeat protein, putative n=1 Tax=Bodo saltans TaxID=75058 RepID=A0A0S4KHH4_BODSA|nr:multi-copy leucine-rich repeat protein, putative [Bodo saltans]|eukprot:CUI15133.1 multi-copy leucine-rich repeat protein, putative [Bodo saltans]
MMRLRLIGWQVGIANHTARRSMYSVMPFTTPNPLEPVVRRYLQHAKSGNVFAARTSEQRLLSDMDRYLNDIATARGRIRDLVLSDTTLSEDTKREKLYTVEHMTDADIESYNFADNPPRIKRPKCDIFPFKVSKETTDAVRAHVEQCCSRGSERALLCSVGCAGSGRSVMHLHTIAAAVRMMEGMVQEYTNGNASERERLRPLGFYVSFKYQTAAEKDVQLRKQEMLSYIDCDCPPDGVPVIDWGGRKASYEDFCAEVLAHCNLGNDEANFRGITAALRAVLAWDGPMFISVDDLELAYKHQVQNISAGLIDVCEALLVNDEALLTRCDGKRPVFESYLAVSAYGAVDPVAAVTKSGRDLIMQPMGGLVPHDITAFLLDTAKMLQSQYADLFGDKPYLRSNAQQFFLIHASLCSGHPNTLFECVEGHSHDIRDGSSFSFFLLTPELRRRIIWLRRGPVVLQVPVDEKSCLDACRLVVGLETENIFDKRCNSSRRLFALSLSKDCAVTQAHPTRALVSPRFLSTIVKYLQGTKYDALRRHCKDLVRAVERHADLALALDEACHQLVRYPGNLSCRVLMARWHKATAISFEDLTFATLRIRFHCVLSEEGATGEKLLGGLLSHIRDDGFLGTTFKRGPLLLVEEVGNSPSFLFDGYSDSDVDYHTNVETARLRAELESARTWWNSNGVTLLQKALPAYRKTHSSSYELLQVALANKQHFCFKPCNPNNHCADSQIFLLEENDGELSWVVIEVQNKLWPDNFEPQTQETTTTPLYVTDKWRQLVAHMPERLVIDGSTHTFRHVRLLITANPVKEEKFVATMSTPPEEMSLYAEANGAFIHMLKTNTRDEIESKVREWATTVRDPRWEETSFPPEDATERARMLLGTMWYHENLLWKENRSQPVPMGHGRVIAECCMDLDTISKWCPTVSMLPGNIAIMQKFLSPDSTSGKDNK